MLVHALYAVRAPTFATTRAVVELTLGIALEERESSHYGGNYFRFNGPDLQEIILQENIEVPEMEPAEPDFPDQPFLLYVSGMPAGSPVVVALEGAPDVFVKLRQHLR